ncbi:MAG: hypothetical protein AB1706_05375 [Pseudomonadota bacterium]|nr:hypothetical protein [Acinetobacter baumannii]
MMFARVFSKLQYAEDFVKLGKFRLNTIKFFKDYVDEHDNNIGDQNEGLIFRFLKDHNAKVQMKVGDVIEEIDYESVCAHSDYVLHNKIFCLYAPNADENQQFTIEEIQQFIALQEETDNLGSHLVIITKPNEFVKRLRAEIIRLGYSMKARLIEYRDFSQPIEIDENEMGFVKSLEFSHQKEYRFMVDDGKNENLPLDISIGSLEDITLMLPIEDFNGNFRIEPKVELE